MRTKAWYRRWRLYCWFCGSHYGRVFIHKQRQFFCSLVTSKVITLTCMFHELSESWHLYFGSYFCGNVSSWMWKCWGFCMAWGSTVALISLGVCAKKWEQHGVCWPSPRQLRVNISDAGWQPKRSLHRPDSALGRIAIIIRYVRPV